MTDTPPSAVRLTAEQRLAWLRLIRSERVGPITFRELLNHYGSAAAAVEAIPELSRRGGAARGIRIASREDAEAELEATEAIGARIVAIGEPGYPVHLRHVDAPPPIVSILGGDEICARPAAAIVGARNASLAGRKLAAGLRPISARPASPSYPGWHAASTPLLTKRPSGREPQPF